MRKEPEQPPAEIAEAFSLLEHFSIIPDHRVDRTKHHKLIDILAIAICAMLSGAEGFTQIAAFGQAKYEWFKTFLELRNGIPSHDTFRCVLSALDPKQFHACFLRWTETLRRAVSGEIVAIDGKALRRAMNKGKGMPYIVSAWSQQNRLVLGQLKVNEKSNEITAVPELLKALELKGCIVTLDAMGCQKKIAKQIVEADADYVLALKGNHEVVHEEVKNFLDDTIQLDAARRGRGQTPVAKLDFYETSEKGHGRIETRRYWQSGDMSWFADRGLWKNLRSVGVVESTREIDGNRTTERRYFLASLELEARRFAEAVRGHWSVENQLHWQLDVSFAEDQSRARTGHAAENLATLRRLALNMLKQDRSKKIGVRSKQKVAGWDNDYLLHLLGLSAG
jgi:predicted transposase YbfD/YdcC